MIMKKNKLQFLLSIVFCAFVFCAFNLNFAAHDARVVDSANLLNGSEEAQLINRLNEISERQNSDVVIVTVPSLDGKSVTAYADDYYDYHDYGMGADKSGILLLVSMEKRDWHISTTGYGITAFTDAGLKYISNKFKPYLSKKNYAKAFNTFADLCDEFITQAKTGKPYDNGNLPKEPLPLWWIPASVGIGLFVAFLITNKMKNKLKTVVKKAGAEDYLRKESLKVERSNDVFLYNTLTKTPKAKKSSGSSTHFGSSGRSHGGSSGKF